MGIALLAAPAYGTAHVPRPGDVPAGAGDLRDSQPGQEADGIVLKRGSGFCPFIINALPNGEVVGNHGFWGAILVVVREQRRQVHCITDRNSRKQGVFWPFPWSLDA